MSSQTTAPARKRRRIPAWIALGILGLLFFGAVIGSPWMQSGANEAPAETVDPRPFYYMAIFGTTMFLLRIGMLLFGFGFDFGADGDVPAGELGPHGADMHTDDQTAAESFKVMTLQTLSAFTMGAGWLGIVALSQWHFSQAGAGGVAFLFGIGLMYLMAILMASMTKFDASGTLKLEQAIGKTAQVYSRIPPAGQGEGQVQMDLNGAVRVLPAVNQTAVELTSYTSVMVMDVTADDKLVVKNATF